MNKLSYEFIKAQLELCEAVLKNGTDIDEIVRLTNQALTIATEHEKTHLVLTVSSYYLFGTFSDYVPNMEKITGYSDLNLYPDDDEKWKEIQVETDCKEFLVFDKNETAVEAIQRYYNFTTILHKKNSYAYSSNQIVFYSPPVEKSYIELWEEINEITLPLAYTNFIGKIGFFSFGYDESTRLISLDEIRKTNIINELNIPWEVKNESFFGYEMEEFLNAFVVFENPEDDYRGYDVGFCLPNSKNKEGELLFINGDHDGFEEHDNFDPNLNPKCNFPI